MGEGGSGGNAVEETAAEKAMAEVISKEWTRFKDVHQPLLNSLSADIQKIGEGEKNLVMGKVNAGITKAYTPAMEASLTPAPGVDPSSGRAVMGLNSLENSKAEALSKSEIQGETGVDTAKLQGLQSMVQMGRGQAGTAMAGMSDIAGNAVNSAITDARISQQNRNDTFETGAALAGAGLAVANTPKPASPWRNPDTGRIR